MLKSCILEVHNIFSHPNRLKNMDTVTAQKISEIPWYSPPPPKPHLIKTYFLAYLESTRYGASNDAFCVEIRPVVLEISGGGGTFCPHQLT